MFTITYSIDAIKSLDRIPANTRRRIMDKISEVADDPTRRNPQLRPLRGMRAMRLKVGNWRVIFEVNHRARAIWIIAINPRQGAYR